MKINENFRENTRLGTKFPNLSMTVLKIQDCPWR